MSRMTLGVIVGNRDFFPDALVAEARRDLGGLFAELGIEPSCSMNSQTKLGAVETWADAQKMRANCFRRNRDRIDGVLVCLPNFGDEKGVADSIRSSAELHVPGSGAGLSRRSRSVRPRPAARRLLRQDLGLQQPAPVRHSIHAHRAITRSDRRSRRVPPRT